MPRVAPVLSCTPEQRAELLRLSGSRTDEARLVERAKIILACSDGRQNQVIASELSVLPNTVARFRQRFIASGVAGLRDAPRPGRPLKMYNNKWYVKRNGSDKIRVGTILNPINLNEGGN